MIGWQILLVFLVITVEAHAAHEETNKKKNVCQANQASRRVGRHACAGEARGAGGPSLTMTVCSYKGGECLIEQFIMRTQDTIGHKWDRM